MTITTPVAASQATLPTVMPPAPVPPRDIQLELFRVITRMRLFEKRVYDVFLKGMTEGPLHLSIGQEAVSAGFGLAVKPGDYFFNTYRGHIQTLARGVPMAGILAELLGRETGLCGGHGGSMHLTSKEHGAMGSYPIIGAHIPLAAGAALSAQIRGTDQVSVCFFGDGTTNIGAFHEALNLAAVWKLPVVFVCENNLYMEYTAIGEVTAVRNPAADRAAAYGLESIIVDGNDPDAMYEIACRTVARARAGDGPSLVEAKTYRHHGHSRAEPGKYRPDEEVAAWVARDPIEQYPRRLLATGVSEETLNGIRKEALAEVERACDVAFAAPRPAPESAFDNLWADGGSSWRN